MTNKERLISLLGFAPDNNALDGELLDANIDGSAVYVSATGNTLKKCAINLLSLILSTADTSFFNGATTAGIKYDRDALLKRMNLLKDELGLLPKSSIIRSITHYS